MSGVNRGLRCEQVEGRKSLTVNTSSSPSSASFCSVDEDVVDPEEHTGRSAEAGKAFELQHSGGWRRLYLLSGPPAPSSRRGQTLWRPPDSGRSGHTSCCPPSSGGTWAWPSCRPGPFLRNTPESPERNHNGRAGSDD